MSNCSLPGLTHRSVSSTVNGWLQSLVDLTCELITVHVSIYIRPALPWCPITVYQTSCTVSVWAFPVSFRNCSYQSWSRHQIIDRDWDLISICIYTEFCIDQLRIPLGVQSTDTTANGGLAPKPPEPGWYPQCLPLWLDGVSIRKDTQSYECFSLCYDDPAPGQGWPREGECGLPSLALRCLDSNSRLVLRYWFGWRNKDTISLDCMALVHPTLLTFIEY